MPTYPIPEETMNCIQCDRKDAIRMEMVLVADRTQYVIACLRCGPPYVWGDTADEAILRWNAAPRKKDNP